MLIRNYWPDEHLPDGTPVSTFGAGYTNVNGVIEGWTGRKCKRCDGTAEDFTRDDGGVACRSCGGTGDEHGPMYLVEE